MAASADEDGGDMEKKQQESGSLGPEFTKYH